MALRKALRARKVRQEKGVGRKCEGGTRHPTDEGGRGRKSRKYLLFLLLSTTRQLPDRFPTIGARPRRVSGARVGWMSGSFVAPSDVRTREARVSSPALV